ncbi:MAG: glycoside hydrolase family 127 protein [Pirellulales bacterium]|nr:glycoside hydrolase family 127 protein [Pirellulales bacterium]
MNPSTRTPSLLWRSSAVACTLMLVLCLAPTTANDRLQPLELGRVKVGGEIGRRIDVTANNNLLVVDVEKDFLQPFEAKGRTEGYVGLGKFIDSIARMAAYSGDPKLVDRKKQVVSEAIAAQEPDGYLGLMAPESRMWKLWDVHEMVYLVYGLTTDYRLFREQSSLDAAKKLADYIVSRWSAEPRRELGEEIITTHMAATGLERAFLYLSEQSGDPKYRRFAIENRKLPQWNLGIVRGRWGRIEGHAYAYMAHALAQTQLYRTSPDENLLAQEKKALDFLCAQNGLVITGTCGDHECWHDTQQGTINLGETCATAYLLRVLDDCLRREGDSRYGDIMERTVYNALFAAQSPDGRRIRYYSPFDGPREYFSGDTYCCPCNYRRIVAELPEMVYYRSQGGVAVNLYTPSTAEIQLGDGCSLRLRQETDYPSSGRAVVQVDPSRPAKFPLLLRIPRWCREAKITVNGQPVPPSAPGGAFVTVERQWKAGDRVELELPMAWRLVKGRAAQAGRVAVMRGPMVFCLDRARHEGLKGVDLRLITLDPSSPEGPIADTTVRPGGIACKVKAWGPGKWYPHGKPELELLLTEFPDPSGEAAYFNVPNPNAGEFVDDELLAAPTGAQTTN